MESDSLEILGKDKLVELKAKGVVVFSTVRYCSSIFNLLDQKNLSPELRGVESYLMGITDWNCPEGGVADCQVTLQSIVEA